ncbi:MAG: hypothetical protein WBL25_13405 [Anaerolineales bacterium]
MNRKLPILFGIMVVLAACVPQTSPDKSNVCPVTQPPEPAFSPPIDTDYEGRFWYGTPTLWTNLPSDGIWRGLPKDDDGYVQKARFWREGFVALDEPKPALTVSGRRLEASAPTFSFSDATHGWDETGDFMLMGISIPTEGCWEITAEYQDAQLTYVVEVVP